MSASVGSIVSSPAWIAVPGRAGNWTRAWAAMVRNARTRRELKSMDDRMLADIGIDRAQARVEADRMPWEFGVVPPAR